MFCYLNFFYITPLKISQWKIHPILSTKIIIVTSIILENLVNSLKQE